MQKITTPTLLRPVLIARLLEQHGSPLAPLAEEIYDLAIFYRIDAAFALAQCMVESKLGCTLPAQVNHNAALVPLAVARLAAPTGPLHPVGTAVPILPPRYTDEFATGYITYPSWLTGLEEYFRILRHIFVDAWHQEKVEDVAHTFLFFAPGRNAARKAPPAGKATQQPSTMPPAARSLSSPVRPQEVNDYARRVARYRALFQGADPAHAAKDSSRQVSPIVAGRQQRQ